ncbi:MAG TPA: pirin family protein [Bacilli bacterium]|nr:pirin family protein [Bacilli bacterium]
MDTLRKVKRIFNGFASHDGAGVKLFRVIGYYGYDRDLDPFLLLDSFDSTNPADYIKGFPFHPHRGMQTITYLVSGKIEHEDSLGNKGTINDGDAQYMTSGRGIIHQEMPKPSPHMLGVQVWVNLPAKDKMCDPIYGNIEAKNVPLIREEGKEIRIISGAYRQYKSPFQAQYVPTNILDVALEPKASFNFSSASDTTLFLYLFSGSLSLNDQKQHAKGKDAVLFTSGDRIIVSADEEGARFLLFEGKPLREPVAWYGPIVMNTRQELEAAFDELDKGTFIKKK